MSLLEDPRLVLSAPADASGRDFVRVRFLPTSRFASDFDIPAGAEGEVTARYRQGGRERVNVQVIGGCYAMGVPADEVAPLERRRQDPPDAR